MSARKTVRRRAGFLRRSIRMLSGALLVLAGVILFLGATEPGGRMVALLVNRLGSNASGSIEIDQVASLLSGSTRAGHVLLHDSAGEPWLLLRGVTIDWSPSMLLGWKLSVASVSVEAIELAKLPAKDASRDSGGLALPINVEIEKFSFPDILIGEAVGGRIGRFRAEGQARVDARLADAIFQAEMTRIDGVGGRAAIDATFSLPHDRFDLDFSLSEPAGGVFAHLAGLGQAGSIDIGGHSEGSLADWRLRVAGQIDGVPAASIRLDVATGSAGQRFDLSSEGALGRFLPPSLAGLFSGNTDLVLSGLLENDHRGLQVDAFSFDSSSVHGEGRGRIADSGEVSLKARVNGTRGPFAVSLGQGTEGARAVVSAIDLDMAGPAEAARIALTTELASLDSASLIAQNLSVSAVFDRFDLRARTGSGHIRASAGSAGAANMIAARALAGELTAEGEIAIEAGKRLAFPDLRVAGDAASLNLAGDYDLAASTGEARFEALMRSAVLSPRLPGWAGESLTASGALTLGAGRAVSVSGLKISAPNLTAEGRFLLDAKREISAELAATVADFSLVDPRLRGGAALEVQIAGPLSSPELTAILEGRGVTIEGKALDGLSVKASAKLDPQNPRGEITLAGNYLGKPVSGAAKLAGKDGIHRIDPLMLAVEGNRLDGSLLLDAEFRPTGTVRLVAHDIAAISALALGDIDGSAEGNLVFSVRDGRPELGIDLDIALLTGQGFRLEGATLKAAIADYLDRPALGGRGQAELLQAGKTSIGGLGVEFEQVDGWTQFKATARIDNAPASLAGRARRLEGRSELELASAKLAYGGLPLTLVRPARIVIAGGFAEIDHMSVSPGRGQVDVSGRAGAALELAVRFNDLPLSAAEAFAPGMGLEGGLSGTARIGGSPSAPEVHYDVAAAGLGATALSGLSLPPLEVSANGKYLAGNVDFNASAKDGRGLLLNSSGRVETGGGKALAIRATGTAPFSLLAPVLAAQSMALDGMAAFDLGIGGTIGAPAYSGSVRTSEARFVDAGSNMAVEDISADVAIENNRLRIGSLAGNIHGGGRLSGSGTIGLEPGHPADLRLQIERGRYGDGKLVATNFDAEMTLQGSLGRSPVLGGVVRLDKTIITVPENLPGSIARLDVRHANASNVVQVQAARLAARGADGGSGGIGLDLSIEAPNQIFVRGRGMDVELGGSLRLVGSTGAPVATGGFALRRGRLSILGKRLDFDRGLISFSGSPVPVLDLTASTSTSEGMATVTISGPATDPAFSFTSVPERPEDEVLALLIFGRSLSNLSPVQIAQLAQAAAELTGAASGGGLVGKLRDATGVDDIDVRTDEKTGDTSIAVGKYLNDRTYVGVEKGTSADSGKARIDLDIGRGLKLRGEASSGGDTRGGIFYERDY